ncbi:PfkB family carbohydrate kinase [Catenovulum sediminis]|uniref:PfkB family carbohydrate kinase n=1 Tax=Catenovulum sediminis TaxID=1740262 RepID=A0ABV1RHH8_9ALTE
MSNQHNLTDIVKNIEMGQSPNRVVLVTGNFNTLHPGHIRLLKFAKECGDILVVGVNSDALIQNPTYMNEAYRSEVLGALGFVDYCFINYDKIEFVITKLKPHVVVKGFEYKSKDNPEKQLIEEFGGKLIFCSGDYSFNASNSVTQASLAPIINKLKLNGYCERHSIDKAACLDVLRRTSKLNIAVIGDVIIDQYVQCNAVGMSQEDPTIVVTPDSKTFFLGGAGITAAHAKALGAHRVFLFSVTGTDSLHQFTHDKLSAYEVDAVIASDETRPTNLKTRYRVGNKTMLRVNEVRSHDIDDDVQKQIMAALTDKIREIDALIFSDFNYGVLPQNLVDEIILLCKKHNVILAADSQSSSQVGDVSRFCGMDLITPTEREARLAINNTKDGLVLLAEKLRQKCDAKNIVVTLAEDGAFLHQPDLDNKNQLTWNNDKIAALAENAVDPAGAGDCYLASATLALAAGASFWQASFLGSIAAACQVSRVGNTPLKQSELINALRDL